MSLFSVHTETFEESHQEAEKYQPHAVRVKGKNKLAIGKKGVRLDELVGTICKGETIHIPSMASWSLVDMIEYVIKQIGPSTVHLTSWAISEDSVVTLLRLRDQKLISSLNCLFASRTPSQCPAAWQFVEANIESLALTRIHAKVAAIKSKTHSVSIVTSANLTNNPRVERYVVTEDESVYEFDRNWIQELINQGTPFDNESK